LARLTTYVISVVMSSSAAPKPVYLRGLPNELVREAKALAARRGVTLAGFVADTLARAVREQGRRVRQGNVEQRADDLSDEMRWYERHTQRLAREFPGEYLAIVGNRVLDHDASFEDLAERVFASADVGNVFMPRVAAGTNLVRVRSPRQSRTARPARRA
jgi:hypothetical protein